MLSFGELASAGSIAKLMDMYRQKGCSFPDKTRFLKRVEADWEGERLRVLSEAKQKGQPRQLLPLEVLVDGAPCRIYGVSHARDNLPEYRAMVEAALSGSANLLAEQNMLTAFPQLEGAVELPDHLLLSTRDVILPSYVKGAVTVLILPFIAVGGPVIGARALVNHMRGHGSASPEESAKGHDNSALNAPLEAIAHAGIPAYVTLELAGRSPPGYNSMQKRSAYLAEFMRVWKPSEERNILTGAAHAAEIAYFLKNGVKNASIIGMARGHAELLKGNHAGFAALKYGRKQSILMQAAQMAGSTSVAGLYAAMASVFFYASG